MISKYEWHDYAGYLQNDVLCFHFCTAMRKFDVLNLLPFFRDHP